jgi:hypothetical protein
MLVALSSDAPRPASSLGVIPVGQPWSQEPGGKDDGSNGQDRGPVYTSSQTPTRNGASVLAAWAWAGASAPNTTGWPLTLRGSPSRKRPAAASTFALRRSPAPVPGIQTSPVVSIEVGIETFKARATITEGAERQRLWDAHVAEFPHFANYEKMTKRELQVVAIERLAPTS